MQTDEYSPLHTKHGDHPQLATELDSTQILQWVMLLCSIASITMILSPRMSSVNDNFLSFLRKKELKFNNFGNCS